MEHTVLLLGAAWSLSACAPGAPPPPPARAPDVTIERALPGPPAPEGARAPARPSPPAQMSCEEARARYIESFDRSAPPDLSAGASGAALNQGSYLNRCGVPSTMTVHLCAAVQNGRAVGVTVKTNPADDARAACVADAVRRLDFPSHPRLDITTTTFAGADP